MNENAVIVTDINYGYISKYTKPYFEQYCEKVKADLIYITESSINIQQEGYPNLRFENLQIREYFDIYERIFLVDCDVIIKPTCPDYFLLNPDSIYVTRLDKFSGYIKWCDSVIKDIQKRIGPVNWRDNFYFNSGVMLFSKAHKEVFDINIDLLNKVRGNTRVQNYINWKVQKLNLNLLDLGPVFNFRATKKIVGEVEKGAAHILHYIGPKDVDSNNFKTLVKDSIIYQNYSSTRTII